MMYRPVVLLVGMVLFVSACVGGPVAAPSSDEAAVPELDLYEQPVADAAGPAARAGAASNFVDCEYGLSNGGWSADVGPTDSSSSPEGALAAFLHQGLFGLPGEGYAVAGRDVDRMLYIYSVAGLPKVAVIVTERADSQGWAFETFATCDPAEYDPSIDDQLTVEVWVDADGNRVPTSIITTLPGAEHCGWQSVTYLLYEDRQYISDPRGMMNVAFVVPFDDDTELPSDAVDTSYRRDGRQLWMSADQTVAYVVEAARVQAWPTPATLEPVWCA